MFSTIVEKGVVNKSLFLGSIHSDRGRQTRHMQTKRII